MYATILSNKCAEPRAARVRDLMARLKVELRDEVDTDSVSQSALDDMAGEFDILPIITLYTDQGTIWDEFDASNVDRLNASSIAGCESFEKRETAAEPRAALGAAGDGENVQSAN